jgi:hypothetical protein
MLTSYNHSFEYNSDANVISHFMVTKIRERNLKGKDGSINRDSKYYPNCYIHPKDKDEF